MKACTSFKNYPGEKTNIKHDTYNYVTLQHLVLLSNSIYIPLVICAFVLSLSIFFVYFLCSSSQRLIRAFINCYIQFPHLHAQPMQICPSVEMNKMTLKRTTKRQISYANKYIQKSDEKKIINGCRVLDHFQKQ